MPRACMTDEANNEEGNNEASTLELYVDQWLHSIALSDMQPRGVAALHHV